jgi:hypothetical protein
MPARPAASFRPVVAPRARLLAALLVALLLGLGAWPGAVRPAAAQPDGHTLTIQDGRVFVDGQRVPPADLPPALDLSGYAGVTAQYRYAGIAEPVVEIGGALYALRDGRLVPVDADTLAARPTSMMMQSARRPGPTEAAAEARFQDREEAHRQYLREVQRHSHGLYERLMHERRMELESYALARRIRQLPEGSPARAAKLDSLRGTLEEIFALKQENRRREIEQLDRQLQELQRRLKQRQDMREAMIDQRLDHLITPPGER